MQLNRAKNKSAVARSEQGVVLDDGKRPFSPEPVIQAHFNHRAHINTAGGVWQRFPGEAELQTDPCREGVDRERGNRAPGLNRVMSGHVADNEPAHIQRLAAGITDIKASRVVRNR